MTRKEIDKFLANTKVYVNGKSKEIQEKLFSLGYSWNNDIKRTVVCHTESPFLFIYEDKVITRSSDMDLFCSHENSEITAEEIIALEITDPTYRPFKTKEECLAEMKKHKFDPKTLQPFDKVVVKDLGEDEVWQAAFFSHIDKGVFPFVCSGSILWRKCIPYNDDTKHLVGTKDEPLEFYRYWED